MKTVLSAINGLYCASETDVGKFTFDINPSLLASYIYRYICNAPFYMSITTYSGGFLQRCICLWV